MLMASSRFGLWTLKACTLSRAALQKARDQPKRRKCRNFPAPRRPIPRHESADRCVAALECRRLFTHTGAPRELIRAASQPFWKEVNTLETEKPARGGPCCPAQNRESLKLLQARDSQKSERASSGNPVSANGLICAGFRPLRRVLSNPKGACMFNYPWNNRNIRFAKAQPLGRGPCWRKGSKFDRGEQWRRSLDRNDRARVLHCAEALERRTKKKHKRDGLLGQSALTVLRCLLFHFQNRESGRLDPSYAQIQKITGFCRETISKALKNLEIAGILEIMRRIVRERVRVWVEEAKKFFVYDRVVQTTNAYMVNYPLPDRREFGDLGTPLLRPEKCQLAESRFSTESTSNFNNINIIDNADTLEEEKQRALDR